ncbi:MAG: response regulator transcription factor, partial [Pseudomonadota bacterium]
EDDAARVRRAVTNGVDGYLLKDQDEDSLLAALAGLVAGAPALSPSITRHLLDFMAAPPEDPFAVLTERERNIVDHLALGESRTAIADTLGISAHTVATHVKSIYRKLDIGSRAELGALAAKSARREG